MIKKRLLFIGGTAILACSSFETSILADYQASRRYRASYGSRDDG